MTYQRMIINITHQGFHTEPFINSFCNNDRESRAPPSFMHGILLVEFHHQRLEISRIPSSSQKPLFLAGEFRRFLDCIFFFLHTCGTFFSRMVLDYVGA